ncbi:MAG: transglycosylase SLT domain-containing protein [Polyangiaceae bacterium]|jgi:membrane-bound lytic murein transglycosylase D|nr:transglycosylase SLT domain-containing protein [Polyangiaceae bacterium]
MRSPLLPPLLLLVLALPSTAAAWQPNPFGPRGAGARTLHARDKHGVFVTADTYAAKKTVSKKNRATPGSTRGRAKLSRAKGPQLPPDPEARRATAGPGQPDRQDQADEAPEQRALRSAERELFAPDAAELEDPLPPAGTPPHLLRGALGPAVHATGLPPQSIRLFDSFDAAPAQAEFIASLSMPDVPVRFSARVLQYLDFYKNDARGRDIAALWYRRTGAFETMLRTALRLHGMPEDLMWVAVVESGLRTTAYSHAGAAGLWQFMPETARLYGLVLDRWVDERLDPVRSTHAACAYLQDLHRRFGSWELALAAYNMGYGGLLAAIRKYNTNDFFELSRFEAGIPWETTLYVPKIIALAVVGKNPEVFGLAKLERNPPAEFDEIDVVPGVSLDAVAQAAQVDVVDVEQLNPQLLASRIPPRPPSRAAAGLWRIRVPKGRAVKVDENLVKARAQDGKLRPYSVRHGESLAQIAAAFGVSEAQVSRDNALRSDEVPRPGTVLLVPDSGPRAGSGATADKSVMVVPLDQQPPEGYRRIFYQVVAGDTIEGVAIAFGVRADELRRWNGWDPRARLHDGMSVMAFVPASTDLSHIRTLSEEQVRVLVVGSVPFFAYFEGLKGRVRTTTVVGKGETWARVSQRVGISIGMLERINRRSRSTELQQGERLVVYVSPAAARAAPASAATASQQQEGRSPIEPPIPEDLPPLGEQTEDERAPGDVRSMVGADGSG